MNDQQQGNMSYFNIHINTFASRWIIHTANVPKYDK